MNHSMLPNLRILSTIFWISTISTIANHHPFQAVHGSSRSSWIDSSSRHSVDRHNPIRIRVVANHPSVPNAPIGPSSRNLSWWTSFLQFLQCPPGPLGRKCHVDQNTNADGTNNNNQNSNDSNNNNGNGNSNSNNNGNNNYANNNNNNANGNNGMNSNNNNSYNGNQNGANNNNNNNYNNNNNNYNNNNNNYNNNNNNNSNNNNNYSQNGGNGNSNGNQNANNGGSSSTNSFQTSSGSSNAASTSSSGGERASPANVYASNRRAIWLSAVLVASVVAAGVAFTLLKAPTTHPLIGSVGKRRGLFERAFFHKMEADLAPTSVEPTTDYVRGPLV